jgi:hypothetical protein
MDAANRFTGPHPDKIVAVCIAEKARELGITEDDLTLPVENKDDLIDGLVKLVEQVDVQQHA